MTNLPRKPKPTSYQLIQPPRVVLNNLLFEKIFGALFRVCIRMMVRIILYERRHCFSRIKHRGDPQCIYDVRWKPLFFRLYKTIKVLDRFQNGRDNDFRNGRMLNHKLDALVKVGWWDNDIEKRASVKWVISNICIV